MAVLTPQQTTAIDTALSVSLPTLTDDRIIELCLLQRAAPEVKPAFVEALNAEITRRFTAAEIAANDVMFSVIQNFANQFTSGVPFFAKKMLEMSASVNRDIWFSNNSSMFAQAIEDETLLEWLVTQPDVVTKILNNTLGLTAIAKSTKASTAILSNAETVAIFKDATNVWQIVTGQSQFMSALVLSGELMTYVVNNSTAMTAVAASSTALSKIVVSTLARNALMTNNVIFQSVRQQIRSTITTNWVMQRSVSGVMDVNTPASAVNSSVANPPGFVLASLGFFASTINGKTEAAHPNGIIAATRGTSAAPNDLSQFDVISFNGVIFTARTDHGGVHAQLWSPN